LDIEFKVFLIGFSGVMFTLAGELVGHVPVNFLMLGRAIEEFATEAAAFVCLFLTNRTLIHPISLAFYYK
jgi:hypothetical protein